MPTIEYPDVAGYVIKGEFRSIYSNLSDSVCLSALEKAILGYLIHASKDPDIKASGVPYPLVYQVAFEYYRQNEPIALLHAVKCNVEDLERLAERLRAKAPKEEVEDIQRIKSIKSSIEQLYEKNPEDWTFTEFYPPELVKMRRSNPFARYHQKIIQELMRLNFLRTFSRGQAGTYVTTNLGGYSDVRIPESKTQPLNIT